MAVSANKFKTGKMTNTVVQQLIKLFQVFWEGFLVKF